MEQRAASSGDCTAKAIAASVSAMKAIAASVSAMKALAASADAIKPSLPTIQPVHWPKPIIAYVYPADRWCAYTVSDYEWAHWCILGRYVRAEYDEVTKTVHKLPSGWVLPDDWFYGCNGSREPIFTGIDWYVLPKPSPLIHVSV